MPLGNPIRKQNESRVVSVLATEGQTVFTVQGGYIINHISVFRNGVRLSNSEDFTAGDGSTVTLNNAANIDDRIEFHVFDRFTVQNAIVGAASTQTIQGDLVINGKIFGNLDVPSVNTGIVTATNLNITGISTFDNVDFSNLDISGITTTGSLISNGAVGIGTTGARGATVEIQDIGGTGPCLLLAGATNAEGDLAIPIDQDFNIGHWNNVDTFIQRFKIDTSGTIDIPGDVGIADTIFHIGDTNTKIRFPAADTITAETGGSERLRINSSGQIGIGTVTPNRQVHQHVSSSSANYYQWTNSTTGVSATNGLLVGITAAEEGLVWNYGNTALRFGSGNAEAFRVDSSQRLLLGTTSAGSASAYYDNLIISNTTSGEGSGITLFANATNGFSAIDFADTAAIGQGRFTYSHGDDSLRIDVGNGERMRITSDGKIKFGSGDAVSISAVEIEKADALLLLRDTAENSAAGDCKYAFGNTNHYPTASISHSWDGTNGGLHFYTRLSGVETEKMRITSTGVVGINTVGARGATFEIQDVAATGPCLLLAGATGTEGDIVVPSDQDLNIGHWNNSDTYTGRLQITTTGRTLIGRGAVTAASNLVAQGGLQVSANGASGAPSLCVGADGTAANTQSLTNNTIKDCRIGYPNYSLSEEPIALISGFVGDGSALTDNNAARIYIGGGTSYMNSANQIRFYTNNSNITTTTGTERMRILPNGNIHIGTQAGVNNADIHLEKVNGGGDVAIRIHNDTGTNSGSTASLLFTVSPTDDFDAQILRYHRESNNFVIQYSSNNPTILLTNDQKLRVGGGAHTVDPICGTGGIDIQAMGSTGFFPFVGGADNTSDAVTRSANTEKQFRMGYPTYGNVSGTVCTFAYLKSDLNDNTINIGGGTGWGYAATQIDFHLGGDITTSTGSQWSRMDHDNSIMRQYWNLVDGSMWNNSDAVDGMAFQGTGRGSLQVVCNRSNGYANVYLNKTNVNGGGSDVRFVACYWNGNAEGNLQYNTSSGDVVIAQESDYRLKKNVADMTNGIDKVKQLRPVTYQWNDLSTKPKGITLDGFIAHEVAEIIPQAVIGSKDATKTDEDGNENVIAAQELEQKYIIPTLTAALKEAIAKIEVLEAKVAALEGS